MDAAQTIDPLVFASGVWDRSITLACLGGELPHVRYRYHEPTEYFGMDVLVVGGGNSAVNAALTLAEAGANVTFGMRRQAVAHQSHLRPFVVRDLEFAIEERRLKFHCDVIVDRVEPGTTWLRPAEYDPEHPAGGRAIGEPFAVPARFVFALLGQKPDTTLFERIGLCLQPDGRPVSDPETFETNVANVFVSGSIAGNKIDIILTGREQAANVIRRIAQRG